LPAPLGPISPRGRARLAGPHPRPVERRRRDAEVAVAHLVALAQLRRRAFEGDLADLEHDGAVGDRERHRRVLLDEHDRDPLAVDLGDHLAQLLDDAWRQPERGLVEQQHARVRHQCAADREHLLLAARQQSGALGVALAQDREELVDAGAGARAGGLVARRQAARAQVLLDCQMAEDPASLGDLDDARAGDVRGLGPDQRAAGEGDRSLPRAQRAGDRPQQGRLACTVVAEHGGDRALRHVEGDAAQGLHRARVADVQVTHLQQRRRYVLGGQHSADADVTSDSHHTSLPGWSVRLGPYQAS